MNFITTKYGLDDVIEYFSVDSNNIEFGRIASYTVFGENDMTYKLLNGVEVTEKEIIGRYIFLKEVSDEVGY